MPFIPTWKTIGRWKAARTTSRLCQQSSIRTCRRRHRYHEMAVWDLVMAQKDPIINDRYLCSAQDNYHPCHHQAVRVDTPIDQSSTASTPRRRPSFNTTLDKAQWRYRRPATWRHRCSSHTDQQEHERTPALRNTHIQVPSECPRHHLFPLHLLLKPDRQARIQHHRHLERTQHFRQCLRRDPLVPENIASPHQRSRTHAIDRRATHRLTHLNRAPSRTCSMPPSLQSTS